MVLTWAPLLFAMRGCTSSSRILESAPLTITETSNVNGVNAKYLPIIKNVCNELAALIEETVREGGFPIVLGGDHSIAIGTLQGLHKARGKPAGVIWVDAHGDINTPVTSPSGNVHGMPLSFALEAGNADPKHTVLVGLRDVDPGEKKVIRALGVTAFSMTDLDRMGMTAVMERALEIVGKDPRSVHVSFDMDGIDPSEAPGVGTPVKGGISYREAHVAMEMLADSGALGSIEITEINPILDRENQTAILAVELILSGLGKSIL